MESKKKQIVTSTLALSLLFVPQFVSQTNAAESSTSESTTVTAESSLAILQQKKVVKKQVGKKTVGKKQSARKPVTKKVSNKKLDGEINVNGRVFSITATDNMIMVFENDESKSPSSKNFDGKIEDLRCHNHYVYVVANVTDPEERRFKFYNVYKYDLLTEKSETLIEYTNDVTFDDTKHIIHTSTISGMGLNGATYDKQNFNM